MGDGIIAAAARWATARESGTHAEATAAFAYLQQAIREAHDAAVAAERARCAGIVADLLDGQDIFAVSWRDVRELRARIAATTPPAQEATHGEG